MVGTVAWEELPLDRHHKLTLDASGSIAVIFASGNVFEYYLSFLNLLKNRLKICFFPFVKIRFSI